MKGFGNVATPGVAYLRYARSVASIPCLEYGSALTHCEVYLGIEEGSSVEDIAYSGFDSAPVPSGVHPCEVVNTPWMELRNAPEVSDVPLLIYEVGGIPLKEYHSALIYCTTSLVEGNPLMEVYSALTWVGGNPLKVVGSVPLSALYGVEEGILLKEVCSARPFALHGEEEDIPLMECDNVQVQSGAPLPYCSMEEDILLKVVYNVPLLVPDEVVVGTPLMVCDNVRVLNGVLFPQSACGVEDIPWKVVCNALPSEEDNPLMEACNVPLLVHGEEVEDIPWKVACSVLP